MRAFLLVIACHLGATALAADEVINFYWAGAGEDVATAGGGSWDRDSSAVWADSAPGGPLVKWTDHRAAIFAGSSGGTVKIAGSVTAAALKFAATAGPFVISCAGNIEFTGEGIACDSWGGQELNLEQTMLTFSNAASAGAGARGGLVAIRSDGLINFTDSATAGRGMLVSRGEMHFAKKSSAANSAIVNTGILIFEDDATSAAAALTNQGILNLEGRVHDFAGTAFANLLGGVIDLSSVEADGVAFGSLTNAAGGAVLVGTKQLTVGSLNLAEGNDLNFDWAAGGGGLIRVTTSMLGNARAGGTRVAVNNPGGWVAGQSLPLLDWSAAGSVLGVQLGDFQLQPLANGFAGTLSLRDARLILTVRASR